MSERLKKLRNIGIMAHIDAGKTTVSERILYFSGKTYKIGEVHEGTAVMDYLEEEQKRGITITSAATKCLWKGHIINLIDTPGHVDFTAEVERSLRVLDGAIAVFDASEGVQAQSETVWRQGKKYGLPCLCFVNKMDKVGADFDMCVASIREKLQTHPVPIQIPIGAGGDFAGLVDLIEEQAFYYDRLEVGADWRQEPIPDSLKDHAQVARHDLIEAAAEFDEELLDAYLHDRPVGPEVLCRGIRKGTLEGKLHPVLVGAALRNMGIRRLLNAVCDFLPSPLDRPAAIAFRDGKDQQKIEIFPDEKKPFVGLAFKIAADKHGDLYYLRIYQGTLRKGSRVLNTNRNRKENITRIFEMHANERQLLDEARAGEIVAVVGLKETLTGDTLTDTHYPVQLESIRFPETVISMSIEPRSAADRNKLGEALRILRREDPTFEHSFDPETGQTLISGMGELHLEILQHKLIRDLGVDVRVSKPRVAYKETISTTAEAEGKFVRQTGGHGQYGHVIIRVEPNLDENGQINRENVFFNGVIGGTVPREYVPAVENGIREGLSSGPFAGYPVVGVKVTLLDGSYHSVDSSDLAFEQAGVLAIREAVSKAGPILLEPIMRVQVIIPDSYFGAVQGGLIAKRGMITNTELHGTMRVIDVRVPLAEMFGYSGELRSVTAGRGSFTMEPLTYERVPEQISEKILLGY